MIQPYPIHGQLLISHKEYRRHLINAAVVFLDFIVCQTGICHFSPQGMARYSYLGIINKGQTVIHIIDHITHTGTGAGGYILKIASRICRYHKKCIHGICFVICRIPMTVTIHGNRYNPSARQFKAGIILSFLAVVAAMEGNYTGGGVVSSCRFRPVYRTCYVITVAVINIQVHNFY